MRILDLPQASIKLLGEHPALDLVNSVDIVRGVQIDALQSGELLAEWACLAGILSSADARALELSPQEAESALAQILHLRLLLRAELERPGELSHDLAARLNAMLPHPLVSAGSDGIGLDVTRSTCADRLLALIAFHVADLLLSVPREQVQQCRGPGCNWFFLDASGGRRQWCLMSGCGNATKARRHRARSRHAVGGT